MAEAFTLYKLIILYMLDKVDFPMTTSQISGFILEKEYTDFFKVQEALSELTASGMLRKETAFNRTLYHLTETGAETLRFFRSNISPSIREDIDKFIREKRYDLQEEVSVKTDYYQYANNEYEVRCQIVENGFSLIDLRLTVPTKKEAETIARTWNRKNQEIYSLLLSKLL